MATDAFLVFTADAKGSPLKGETQDAQFKSMGAVEVSSYSLGVHNTITIGSAMGGAGAGKAQFTEFKIDKTVDVVSPTLFQYLVSGQHFQQIDLYLRKGGAASATSHFLRYSFKLVVVADIAWSGGTGEDTVREQVTLAYGALRIRYTPQGANGKPGTAVESAWSKVTNKTNFDVPGVPVIPGQG